MYIFIRDCEAKHYLTIKLGKCRQSFHGQVQIAIHSHLLSRNISFEWNPLLLILFDRFMTCVMCVSESLVHSLQFGLILPVDLVL